MTLTAVVVTYARLPARELYHVSGGGLRGGLGRAVVDLNFPDALLALAVLGVLVPFLSRVRQRVAFVAALLCVVGPATVRQGNLDVRWSNAPAAVGVATAFALTFGARGPQSPTHVRGDRLRLALGLVLTVIALPWLAAALGESIDTRAVSYRGNAPHVAVHDGMHHGLYGLMLVLTALLLSRLPNRISPVLALLLTYGVANIANDAWLEQVAERGWTSWTVPSVTEPGATWTWLAVLLATPLVWALWFRQRETANRRTRQSPRPTSRT